MAFTESVDQIVADNRSGLLGADPTWRRLPIGDFARVQSGAPFKSARFNREGRGIPLIRIRDVARGSTETYYDGDYDEEYVVEEGDLIIGMDGDFNHALWPGPPALLNQRVCRLIFSDDSPLLKLFVFHVLGGYLQAINAATPSVTVKHLSSKTVAQIPLPCPPADVQARIVAGIDHRSSRIDQASSDLSRSAGSLTAFKLSLFAAAVSGGLGVSGDDGETGRELLDRILDERRSRWEEEQGTAGPSGRRSRRSRYREPIAVSGTPDIQLPETWAWATVDQLTTLVQYGTSAKTNADADGIPVLRMGNIVDGRLSYDNLKYLGRDHAAFPGLFLESGDVLFNRTNSPDLVGKSAVYRGEPAPCSFASYLIRVRMSGGYRPELLVFFLSSVFGRKWVRSVVSQQVGQANINGTKLRHLAVPVPPRRAQDRICEAVSRGLAKADDLEGVLRAADRNGEALRRSVLVRALSGNLDGRDGDSLKAAA